MTRFYKTYKKLCDRDGKSPNAVAKQLGISSGSVTAWKQGRRPKYETIEKIADFFQVDVEDFFLSEGPRTQEEIEEDNIRWEGIQLGIGLMNKPRSTMDIDPDLAQYLDILKNRPEMRMLFDVSKNATKEQIESIVHFIEGMIR